jgi:hypothetical protein
LLLSLLYESGTIRHIREHIESKDANAKVYALEIGDMMLDDEIKELFFPIFDDLPVQEKLNRFRYRFPQLKLTSRQRLTDIINKDYTKISCWTKACAIEMAGKDCDPNNKNEIQILLAANIVNPDPIIAELAAWLLALIDKPYYFDTVVRFNREDSSKLSGVSSRINARERNQYHLIYEKILLLKNTHLFEMMPESKLAELLPADQNLNSGEDFSQSSTIEPADKIEIEVGEGLTLAVSAEKLYESMTGDIPFMERYLQSFFKLNINKEYE